MSRQKGREVQVEISTAEGSPIALASVTKAAPPVATSVAHGLANGAVGYLASLTGMVSLEGQAVRVAGQTTDTFQMADLSSVGQPDWGAGNYVPISTWSSFGIITSFEQAGGEGIESDVGTIHDSIDQVEYGGLSAQTFSFNSLFELPNGAALAALRTAAFAQAFVVLRITFRNGAQLIARGQPSLPSISLAKAETGTRTFGFAVKGRVLELPAVA
jgi:hypothetical protein